MCVHVCVLLTCVRAVREDPEAECSLTLTAYTMVMITMMVMAMMVMKMVWGLVPGGWGGGF